MNGHSPEKVKGVKGRSQARALQRRGLRLQSLFFQERLAPPNLQLKEKREKKAVHEPDKQTKLASTLTISIPQVEMSLFFFFFFVLFEMTHVKAKQA